jgi:hypothetical protein
VVPACRAGKEKSLVHCWFAVYGHVANIMIIARVSGYWQEIILGAILILLFAWTLLLKKENTFQLLILGKTVAAQLRRHL